jgi:CubicO group peptidase (beta-lactamase class C family)
MSSCGQPAASTDPTGQAVDAYLDALVPFGFWGAALIAVDGKVILNQGYGWADSAHKVPNSIDTLFGIQSVTKQFTAAAILALYEDGKLNLDASIAAFLPNVPDDKRAITVRHLLHHTAGVMTGTEERVDDMSRDGVVRAVLASSLSFQPGTDFEYSNLGYELLAAIVEIRSGRSYDDYLRERLFERAGMTSTGHHAGETRGVAAHWYGEDGDTGDPRAWPFPDWNSYGSAGVLTTTRDMARWHAALRDDRVLSDATREILFTPDRNDYACGWRVTDGTHGRLIHHDGGSSRGGATVFRRYMDHNIVLILFANRDGETMLFNEGIADQVERIVFGEAMALPPKTRSFNPDDRARLAGEYRALDARLLLETDGDRLILRAFGQSAVNAVLKIERTAAENGRTTTAGLIFNMYAATDTTALHGAFATSKNGTNFVRYFNQKRDEDEALFGPLLRYDVLGSTPAWNADFAQSITFMQAQYERGSRIFRLYWKGDNLVAVGGSGIREPVRVQLLPGPDGTLVGYHIPTATVLTVRMMDVEKGVPARLKIGDVMAFNRVE